MGSCTRLAANGAEIARTHRRHDMAVAKVIEIIGSSTKGWDDAAQQAVATAAKSLRNITGVDVKAQTAKVEDGKIVRYHTTLNLAFVVDDVS